MAALPKKAQPSAFFYENAMANRSVREWRRTASPRLPWPVRMQTRRRGTRLNQFAVVPPDSTDATGKSRAQRTLVLAGLAHALHDGFTNMIYLLLPVWQAQFAPGYAALAELRALNVGAASVGWKTIEVRTAIFF